MRKSPLIRRIAYATVLVTAVVFIAWMSLKGPAEPVYQGKRLSQWLENYDHERLSTPRGADTATDLAVRQMGTNALPVISKLLREHDSPIKKELIRFIYKHPTLRFLPVHPQGQAQFRALKAISALGDSARPLLPSMADSLDRWDDGPLLANACNWLRGFGPDGEVAVPALIRIIKGTSGVSRCFALEAIAGVGTRQKAVVLPVLTACLYDKDAIVRLQANNEFTRPAWIGLRPTNAPSWQTPVNQ